jgi:hypothetical protein
MDPEKSGGSQWVWSFDNRLINLKGYLSIDSLINYKMRSLLLLYRNSSILRYHVLNINQMIKNFRCVETEKIWNGTVSKKFPFLI